MDNKPDTTPSPRVPIPAFLEKKAVSIEFNKGDTVVYRGQKAQHIYLIQEGHVLLQVEFESGDYYSYAHIGPGRFIGDLEVLSGKMEFVGVLIASEDTKALRFPADSFLQALEDDLFFMRHVVKQMSIALYETSYHRGQNRYKTSKEKLGRLLLQHATADNHSNIPVKVGFTRQQLASELGVNVKTVNRGVSALAAEGLIGLAQGKIIISQSQKQALNTRFKLFD